jgi:hypothetical protein
LAAADLAATASFFFWSALFALDCFWLDFFWLDFGDLSPMILIFFRGLIHLRHISFSEGKASLPAVEVDVNDGRKFIGRDRGRAVAERFRWGGFSPS